MDALEKLTMVIRESFSDRYLRAIVAECAIIAQAVLDAGWCERNAVLEEAAQAAMIDSMGPVGDPCCMHTRDNVEQAIVDAIRALKRPTP